MALMLKASLSEFTFNHQSVSSERERKRERERERISLFFLLEPSFLALRLAIAGVRHHPKKEECYEPSCLFLSRSQMQRKKIICTTANGEREGKSI